MPSLEENISSPVLYKVKNKISGKCQPNYDDAIMIIVTDKIMK